MKDLKEIMKEGRDALITMKSKMTNCECIELGKYVTIFENTLNQLERYCEMVTQQRDHWHFNSNLVGKLLNEYERAFEVLIKKRVDLVWLRACKSVEGYNSPEDENIIPLTKREFNFLKKHLMGEYL